MDKVLLDTNIILDIALKRAPHFNRAVSLFSLIDSNKIAGFITATTVTDIYYIAKKVKGHEVAIQFLSNLLEVIGILGVDREIILEALKSDLKDFEDSVQLMATELYELDCIITRNTKDFTSSKIKIYSPIEFLKSKA